MKAHVWIKEIIDTPGLGLNDFWKCEVCEAAGGPVLGNESKPKSTHLPFLADGTGLKLSHDCEISKVQVDTAKYLRDYYLSVVRQKALLRNASKKK